MRTIVAVTCALGVGAPSRADTPAPAAGPAAPAGALAQPAQAPSRVPEIVATILTGGIVIGTGVTYYKWDAAQDLRRSAQWRTDLTPEQHQEHIDDANRWRDRTWVMFGASFVAVAVTTFIWMRDQDPSSFSVQPTSDGAAVSYGGRF